MMYFHPRSSHSSPFKFLHLYGFLCVFVYVNLSIAAAEESSKHHPAHCSAPTLVETLALRLPLSVCPLPRECPHLQQHAPEAVHPLTPRVAELNETTLEKALDLVHTSNGTYMAVLYYATWCPFSRNVRPIYDVLSAKFPAIHHVAVEESSVRPSVLSQYGVHSFPILFMHSRTSRVRYYGPRTLEKLIYFYQNYTGLRAAEGHLGRGEECAFARLVYNADNENKEVCPYPWAISPEKWLQDDTYLSLAIMFLGLRIIFIVVPILVSRVKKHWERRRNQAIPLRPNLPVPSSDRISSPGSSSRVVEGAEGAKGEPHIGSTAGSSISVAGWPRQLAPSSSMAIAESSSSRAGPSDEVYDIGRKQNVDNIFLHRSNRVL